MPRRVCLPGHFLFRSVDGIDLQIDGVLFAPAGGKSKDAIQPGEFFVAGFEAHEFAKVVFVGRHRFAASHAGHDFGRSVAHALAGQVDQGTAVGLHEAAYFKFHDAVVTQGLPVAAAIENFSAEFFALEGAAQNAHDPQVPGVAFAEVQDVIELGVDFEEGVELDHGVSFFRIMGRVICVDDNWASVLKEGAWQR